MATKTEKHTDEAQAAKIKLKYRDACEKREMVYSMLSQAEAKDAMSKKKYAVQKFEKRFNEMKEKFIGPVEEKHQENIQVAILNTSVEKKDGDTKLLVPEKGGKFNYATNIELGTQRVKKVNELEKAHKKLVDNIEVEFEPYIWDKPDYETIDLYLLEELAGFFLPLDAVAQAEAFWKQKEAAKANAEAATA